jgi:tetratricopeptide (TPR) repeat protein
MRNAIRPTVPVLLSVLLAAASLPGLEAPTPAALEAQEFDSLLEQIRKGNANDDQVIQLLRLGRKLGKPNAAFQGARAHLERNVSPRPELLRLAAENAFHAGQFQTAILRAKAYLQAAPASPEASEVAALLYHTLLDFRNDAEGAYQAVRLQGAKFRQSPAARKLDAWFLEEAARRRDFAAHAERLGLIFSEKLPLEQERWHYWPELDRLLDEAARCGKEVLETGPQLLRLAALIRGNPLRAARARFLAQNLIFKAESAGKPETEQAPSFKAVGDAAMQYVEAAPTAGTLTEVLCVLAGGAPGFNPKEWQVLEHFKRRVFVAALPKLPAAEHKLLAPWRADGRAVLPLCAGVGEWAELAGSCPELFKAPAFARDFEPPGKPDDLAQYKKLSAALKGAPSLYAAKVNALAAAPDLPACARHLAEKEAWHLEFSEVYRLLSSEVWPAIRDLPRAEKDKLPADYWDKFLAAFGAEHVARSPVALFDAEAVRDYLLAAWRRTGDAPQEKAAFLPHLEGLAWAPAFREQESPLAQLQSQFQEWAGKWRRAAKSREKTASDADLATISKLEAALRALTQNKEGDPARAPNGLCQKLAAVVVAARNRTSPDFHSLAREAYLLAREGVAQRSPYAEAVINYLARARQDAFDLQIEILEDQLQQAGPQDQARRFQELVNAMSGAQQGFWRDLSRISPTEQAKAKRLNQALGKLLIIQAEQGHFTPTLFHWFRQTRRGDRWGDADAGNEALEKLFEKRTLLAAGWRPEPRVRSGAGACMWLVAQEFRGLQNKYPPGSAFDDLFVEEARATGTLDAFYWAHGLDLKSKVAGAAAEMLGAREALPLGYDGQKPLCAGREEYLLWLDKIAGAAPEVRDAFVSKHQGRFGRSRFDAVAMGRTYFHTRGEPRAAEGRPEFFARLAQFFGKARASLQREPLPYLAKLSCLEEPGATPLSREESDALAAVFGDAAPWRWPGGYGYDIVGRVLYRSLLAQNRAPELFVLIPQLWRLARDTRDQSLRDLLAGWTREHFDKKESELALAHALSALALLGAALPEEMQTTFASIRAQAPGATPVLVQVDRDNPNYPLFAAQAAYATGNLQAAAELAAPHLGRLADKDRIKDFDPGFCLWLIRRQVETLDYDVAEKLARALKGWLETRGAASDPEARARADLAFAHIAFGRRSFPLAKALYEKIAVAREYEGTQSALEAEIQLAEIERLTKQYDQALTRLEKLAKRKERYLQAEAPYHMALVKYDQEEYADAQKLLDQLFILESNHAEGRILEGNVALKLKKLEQATLVKLGIASSQRVIVPGKPLRISLEDRNLAIVGKSTNIEIRAWTANGDEETFLLLPFGDSKTRFQGQLPTAMGAVSKRDGALQVFGQEVIQYDFTDAFRRSHGIPAQTPPTLSVATDAELYASSGRILTRKEAEEQALERMLIERLALESSQKGQVPEVALSTIRPQDQVKPGNSINVRVVDPDRNTSPRQDKVGIRVSASSGDAIRNFQLTETEGHSGVFEGSVPTATAEATAFASDSAEGSQPNFAISAGSYPAWMGQPDSVRPKLFTLDLKDNVALGKLILTAREPNRRLKGFTLQTSFNGRDFRTIGRWPEEFEPWGGALEVEMFRVDARKPLSSLDEIQSYMQFGHLAARSPRVVVRPGSLSLGWEKELGMKARDLEMADDSQVLIHLYGAFLIEKRQAITFQLEPKARGRTATAWLVVDGAPAADRLTLTRTFQKGVYRLDAYLVSPRSAAPGLDLLSDIEAPPNLGVCPTGIFDPEKHPEIKPYCAQPRASILPGADQSTFGISFEAGARTRLLRFILQDFETDAPAINRITLTDAEGKALLPTQQDLLKLKDNQVLEIVPGDRINLAYEDPVTLTPNNQLHEASLRATFTNAALSACFVEYGEPDRTGERRAHYFTMWRFQPGEKINVFIRDPDCDVSEKPDRVTFKAHATHGDPIELEALETAAHAGVFIGAFFPVPGAPQRKTEVQVKEGDEVTITYFDRENTEPGIPWERGVSIEQSYYVEPQLRLYDVAAEAPGEAARRGPGAKGAKGVKGPKGARAPAPPKAVAATGEEAVPATRVMVAVRPEAPAGETPASLLMEGPLVAEVLWPTLALSPESKAELYVQTSAGRKKMKEPLTTPFDLRVPGTIRVLTGPGGAARLSPPPGFREFVVRSETRSAGAPEEGRFTFTVPLTLGPVADESLVEEAAGARGRAGRESVSLPIRGDDEIFVGFKYTDSKKATRWLLGQAKLSSGAQLDIMDRRYEQVAESAYVGETLYFRLIHLAQDRSDEKDRVTLELSATSGTKKTVELVETYDHSGAFKGFARLTHAQDPEAAAGISFPVQYGDTVTLSYSGGLSREVFVHKGSDGTVAPFTKRFKDAAVAVQTQFTVAEAYFELAKKHRALKEESFARRELAQGKKLLQEALRDNPDATLRAQGEYLLANLTFEFAQLADNEDMRKQGYQEALSRFNDLVASYPDSPYAAKSQFKKALCLEKMGQMDQACEEYVKLSYRYPDSDLIADTIARLGQYFMMKGKEFTDQAKAKGEEAKAEADQEKVKAAKLESEKLNLRAQATYRTAGQVFSRLAPRFPTHSLAPRCLVLSGQCFIYAQEMHAAVDSLKRAAEDPNAEKDSVAEALYWLGHAYMEIADLPNAYRSFKKATWDYPNTTWGRYAANRLADPKLARIRE